MGDKQQFILSKIPIRLLIENSYNVTLNKDEEIEYLIAQGTSLLFDQIERIRGKYSKRINELILVVAKKNKKTEDNLKYILNNGFNYNGKHYKRFGKSASQGKDGITAFVINDIYEELFMVTQMDIEIDECVISKYEAQRCLPFSSCTLIKDYFPNICIIDEYEKMLYDNEIKYVEEVEKDFIDKKTGETKKYKSREIKDGKYDIKLSPFDGCGCHEVEFKGNISKALKLDYEPIGAQVRLPFIKGYTVYVPFRQILKSWNINTITDVYGVIHNVDDIDCIWNTSMFKGHKIFKEKYKNDAWKEYENTIKKYNFKLGISKYSHHIKHLSLMSKMNFQYLQCLNLINDKYIEKFKNKDDNYDILDESNDGKIIKLGKYTTNLYEKIIKGDKFYTYKFMGVNDTENYTSESNYVKACLINDTMLKDPAVKQFIHRKLKKSIEEAKYGKIYCKGFYHTVIGDMIGYLEYVANREVKGCLNAHEFYCKTLEVGECISFRSPLVCPSEVNKIKIVDNEITKKWFEYFKEQDVVMLNMYDLSLPQQGGMDEDGDAVFLSNDEIIIKSKIDKHIIIDIEDKATAMSKKYTTENITNYEMNSRDNRIGEITNVATCIENRYTENKEAIKMYSDYASLLRIFQGKEIDFLKTGLRWQLNKGLKKFSEQLPYFLLYNYPNKLKTYDKLIKKNKTIEDKDKKLPLNAYKSPSQMNELCDYINTWEKKHIVWDRNIVNTDSIILNNKYDFTNKKAMKEIKHIINEYAVKLKDLIDKESNSSERDYNATDILKEYYMSKLSEIISDEEELANYVIKVSYSNMSVSKSLAWSGYGDYILKNLTENSPSNKKVTITEVKYETKDTYEYLGKYYEFKEGD